VYRGATLPPRESSSAEYYNHKILSSVIDDVLRRQKGGVRVPELAAAAGFSRFHLSRMFHYAVDETLEEFIRRIRLERAAYLLLHSDQMILQIAVESGYKSREAFSRAFKRTFGCVPTEAKHQLSHWEIPSKSDLHWIADWVFQHSDIDLEERQRDLAMRYACVVRTVGDYARLEESWKKLEQRIGSAIPSEGSFITLYRDNFWTHPVCRTLRADIGWLCSADAPVPPGMRKICIPAGRYATTRWVNRDDRTTAWSKMLGQYPQPHGKKADWVLYDEYSARPIPFDSVKTRVYIRPI